MKSVSWSLLLPALLAAACGPAPDDAGQAGADAGPLHVYVPTGLEDRLRPALAGYTSTTGVRIELHVADRATADVVAGDDDPRADLLVLASAGEAVQAVDEGGLRPVAREAGASLPERLRDPDGNWVVLEWVPAVIAYDVRYVRPEDVGGYADLAGDAFSGRLCLTSSAAPLNTGVIAALIAERDVRSAELVVRGWVRNLAMAVFASDAELEAAVADGRCAAAILPVRFAAAVPGSTTTVRYRTPGNAAGQVIAAGVARHAGQPEAALALLEWLAARADVPASAALPAADVAATGWLHEDARKLAERAGYR